MTASDLAALLVRAYRDEGWRVFLGPDRRPMLSWPGPGPCPIPPGEPLRLGGAWLGNVDAIAAWLAAEQAGEVSPAGDIESENTNQHKAFQPEEDETMIDDDPRALDNAGDTPTVIAVKFMPSDPWIPAGRKPDAYVTIPPPNDEPPDAA